jgi:DHA2 family multidrug resistance protein-like MFS transporter
MNQRPTPFLSILVCSLLIFFSQYAVCSTLTTATLLQSVYHLSLDSSASFHIYYGIVFGGSLLILGRLADQFGYKKMLLVGLGGFGGCALLLYVPISFPLVLMIHTLQAVFNALIFCAAFACALLSTEKYKPLVIASLTATTLLGIGIAPLTNAILLQQLHWHTLFGLETLGTVFLACLTIFFIPQFKAKTVKSFDWLGWSLWFVFGLSVSYLINNNSIYGGPVIYFDVGVFITLLSFLLLIIRNLLARNPLLHFSTFMNRVYVSALILRFCIQIALMAILLFVSFYLQSIFGYSLFEMGIYLIHLFLIAIVGAFVAGFLILYMDANKVMLFGTAIAIISFWLLFNIDDILLTSHNILPYLYVFGFGLGIVLAANSSLIINNLPNHYLGFNIGVIYFVASLGNGVSFYIGNFIAQYRALQTISENFLRLGIRTSHEHYQQITNAVQSFQLDHYLISHYPKHVLQKIIPVVSHIYPHAFASSVGAYISILLIGFGVMVLVSLNGMKKK